MKMLLARFGASRRANSATEFAIVLPIMLLFMGGIVEFGRAYVAYVAVNSLATRYAITYADCFDFNSTTQQNGACDASANVNSNLEYAWLTSASSIANMAPQLTNAVSLRLFEVSMSGASPPTATIVYPSGSSATLSATELSQAQSSIGAGQYGVIATVSYQHTLIFFSKLMSPFLGSTRSISYTVAQRKT